MDEALARQVSRQLRSIRRWLRFFGLLVLLLCILLGFIAWKVVSFTQHVNTEITTIKQTTQEKLDIKAQFCTDTNKNLTIQQLCQ